MDLIQKLKERVRKYQNSIVLPEGDEPRILGAAKALKEEGLCKSVYLLGDEKKIREAAQKAGVSIDDMTIEMPGSAAFMDEFTLEYFELRKSKGMTIDEAKKKIIHPLFWGAMMVKKGRVDAMVGGAVNSSADVLRSTLQIIKTAEGIKVASSCFVMCHPDTRWGHEGNMIFADCAIMPVPTPEELAEIAITSAASCRRFLDVEPMVALLSFSTKGSASHPVIDKVKEALAIIKQRRPDIKVDGELQVDAALIPSVASQKAPGSEVAGRANVLIFPNLEAGNIGYKITQRLGGAKAYGPLLQGFAKPVSDLSRGCTVEDVVNAAVFTLLK
jgi:phosphate acetyltransferase